MRLDGEKDDFSVLERGIHNMITAVCLNPCIDKMVKVDSFIVGGLNRILESTIDGSGKGVNVAIACQQIGCESACIGFLYDANGQIIQKRLESYQVITDFLWKMGEVRTNLKVADIKNGTYTEINEKGMAITEDQIEFIKSKVKEFASKSSIMVFTGSLPQGCPKDFYKVLIEIAKLEGTKCILDAEGEALLKGTDAIPYLIKPNIVELEQAIGLRLQSPMEVYNAALAFIDKGISIVAVSMGSEGAVITDGEKAYYAPIIPVEVRSTVGAGDSMVAGFCKAIEMGLPLKEMFRYGVAGATASVMTEGTQLIRFSDFEALLDRVVIQRIV
jgi:1-phosphofructokinase